MAREDNGHCQSRRPVMGVKRRWWYGAQPGQTTNGLVENEVDLIEDSSGGREAGKGWAKLIRGSEK